MSQEIAKEKIIKLIEEINYHNHLYYNEDRSEISDFEYDTKLKELEKLETEYPEFIFQESPTKRVGGTITKKFNTVVHKIPMLSLGNTYSFEELIEFDERIKKGLNTDDYQYVCELKFDGLAVSLIYRNGILSQAVTRGDGTKGDEITENIKTIMSLPLKIYSGKIPDEFEVRGEVFMPLKEFEALNQKKKELGETLLANPRNTASGTLKLQDSKIVASRKLDCYVYNFFCDTINIETHAQSLEILKKMNFKASPHYKVCNNIQDVFNFINSWETKKKDLPLDIDGIVIKINSIAHQQKLGFTSKFPRWAISYKYKSESALSQLKSITYQVGRTGAITPVANIEPVSLGGSIVKRASLHNANEIERLDLHHNDFVYVEKGGEIIPKITRVDASKRLTNAQKIEYIKNCPDCGSLLVKNENEAVHYCTNEQNCKPQILKKIEHFISRDALNIETIGPQTIKGLLDAQLIKDVADLFYLKFEQLNGLTFFDEETESKRSLKEKSAQNIIISIENAKKSNFSNVLYGLGIRFVGKTVAEKLASHFGNIDNLKLASLEQLLDIDEIGARIAESVFQYFKDTKNLEVIEKLQNVGIDFEIKNQGIKSEKLNGSTFVISGTFINFNRDEIKNLIKINGGKLLSSVSKNTNYIIAGENMGASKKEKAEEFGIKIISENDFINMIK